MGRSRPSLALGTDAITTARRMSVVSMLAKEIPNYSSFRVGTKRSTWVVGLRAMGKIGDEAIELFQRFRRLEEAGACSLEVEVIPAKVM